MKKRYTFILLLIVMLYMIFLVLSYKYQEYKIYLTIQKLNDNNELLISSIEKSQDTLENKSTLAYKNKILKAQQGLKNPGEEVIFLISEEKYKKYTEQSENNPTQIQTPSNLREEESLIQTMTIYQRWIYLIFGKDIR
ncbi:hypothetical protein GW846_04905 [Candidatus Gracilibacteria bacterium]|nr:hypothetical protein [Candidatus Gracilibacteria bacterium]